mmetsp:Transcript_9127/g.20321  ORF Transcript_9127/g.20321 Transcript_9127/m.20321 type:complete len:365 (+) Transcript_9127:28-1122(+)
MEQAGTSYGTMSARQAVAQEAQNFEGVFLAWSYRSLHHSWNKQSTGGPNHCHCASLKSPSSLIPRGSNLWLSCPVGVTCIQNVLHDLAGFHLLLVHCAANLLLRNCCLSLLNCMLLQLAMLLNLVIVHLPEQLLLMLLGNSALSTLPATCQLIQSGYLIVDAFSLLLELILESGAQVLLELHLLRTVCVDFVHKLPSCKLLLFPLSILLGPLSLRLLVLQSDQLLFVLSVLGHFDLQCLSELDGLLLGLLLLKLLHRGHFTLSFQDSSDKGFVKVLLILRFLCPLGLLHSNELVCLLSVLSCKNLFSGKSLLFFTLLLSPKGLHLSRFLLSLLLVCRHAMSFHVELNPQDPLLLTQPFLLQLLF